MRSKKEKEKMIYMKGSNIRSAGLINIVFMVAEAFIVCMSSDYIDSVTKRSFVNWLADVVDATEICSFSGIW